MSKTPSKLRLKLHTVRRWLAAATLPRYGYDGIDSDAALIFKNTGKKVPGFVAGYVSGGYAWSVADWDLFNGVHGPATTCVRIATNAGVDNGDVLDVENGDATPGQTEGWIRMRKAAGYYRPTIYCSRSVIPDVRAGTGPYKLGVDYDIWVADWTGAPHEVAGCVATQYASGSWCDYNVAYDAGWPHRFKPAPKPVPKPVPVPPKPVPPVTPPKPPVKPPAPPVAKSVRHVSTGTVSLAAAAQQWKSTVYAILLCSFASETVANQDALLEYLSQDGGPGQPMPKGLVYWVPPAK